MRMNPFLLSLSLDMIRFVPMCFAIDLYPEHRSKMAFMMMLNIGVILSAVANAGIKCIGIMTFISDHNFHTKSDYILILNSVPPINRDRDVQFPKNHGPYDVF